MTIFFITCFTAFLITFFVIPRVIKIVKIKKLFDTPNKRSAHTANTPTMGGIGIFFGVVISTLIQGPAFFLQEMHLVLCGLMVIFLIGLSDDLIAISPYQKLGAQFVAAMFLVAVDIRLTSFYGVFGIYELPDLLSIPFTYYL